MHTYTHMHTHTHWLDFDFCLQRVCGQTQIGVLWKKTSRECFQTRVSMVFFDLSMFFCKKLLSFLFVAPLCCPLCICICLWLWLCLCFTLLRSCCVAVWHSLIHIKYCADPNSDKNNMGTQFGHAKQWPSACEQFYLLQPKFTRLIVGSDVFFNVLFSCT